MLARQKRQRQAYEERRAKKTRGFSAKSSVIPPIAHHEAFRRRQHKLPRKTNRSLPSLLYHPSTSLANELPPVVEDSETENPKEPPIPEDHIPASESMELVA